MSHIGINLLNFLYDRSVAVFKSLLLYIFDLIRKNTIPNRTVY
jgi:hypothetical protein